MGFHHNSPFGWTTKPCPSHLACVTSQGLEAVLYWPLHQIKVAFISFISHLLIYFDNQSSSLSFLKLDFLTKTCWLSRCFLLVHTLALYQFSKLFPLSMKPRAVLYDSNFVFWKHWPSTCIINKNTILDIAWHYHI